MISGTVPFDADSEYELMRQVLEREPPSLAGWIAAPAGHLEAVIHQAMDKDPARRFQSCEALQRALAGESAPGGPAEEGRQRVEPEPAETKGRENRAELDGELRAAYERRDGDAVEQLLARGADPNVRDRRGKRIYCTTLDWGQIGVPCAALVPTIAATRAYRGAAVLWIVFLVVLVIGCSGLAISSGDAVLGALVVLFGGGCAVWILEAAVVSLMSDDPPTG